MAGFNAPPKLLGFCVCCKPPFVFTRGVSRPPALISWVSLWSKYRPASVAHLPATPVPSSAEKATGAESAAMPNIIAIQIFAFMDSSGGPDQKAFQG
jgi:hypothetical protein